MKTINLTYCGMAGAGQTGKEAKQDAARKIEASLTGSYDPVVLVHKQSAVLLYRNARDGWKEVILRGEDGALRAGELYGCGSGQPYAECRRRALLNLAQLAWDGERDLPRFLDHEQKKDFAQWIGFQLAYRQKKANGDADPHQWACEHAGEFAPPVV